MKITFDSKIPANKRVLVSYIKASLDMERALYGELLVDSYIKSTRYGERVNGMSRARIQDDFWQYLMSYYDK